MSDSFLKMISTANQGGTVINYSNRFTLKGMTGSLQQTYIEAVKALDGNTTGPPTVNEVIISSTISSSATVTTSASSASSISSTNTIATVTTAPAAATTTTFATAAAKPHGLSTGLQAGIGAGVAVCALGLIGLVVFTLLQRRRKRTHRWPDDDMSHAGQRPDGAMPKKDMTHVKCIELGPEGEVSEADGVGRLPEMDEKNTRFELDGSQSELEGSPVSHESPG